MPLDARALGFLQMLHRIDAPRMHELPIEVVRRNFDKMLFLYRGGDDARKSVCVQDWQIPRHEHAGGPLSARFYRPSGATDVALPVLLWLHGGGWSLGSLASYDPLCRALADEAGVAVLALDYRLAPEQRFPAAVDDVWQALGWLRREAVRLRIDANRIAVGGDSAGGNLAATAALMARDAGIALAQQLLIYPAVDCLNEPAADGPDAQHYFLDLDGLRWFCHNYFAAEADRRDWRASPLLASSHAGLAPAVIITAEYDLLTPGAAAYADKLGAAGVVTRYRQLAGTIHGFLTFPRLFPMAGEAIALIARYLREDFGLENIA